MLLIVRRLIRRFSSVDVLLSFFGLALGSAAVSLALAVVRFETGFDRWPVDTGNLYRIDTPRPGMPRLSYAITTPGLAPWLVEVGQPDVQAAARLGQSSSTTLSPAADLQRQVTAAISFADSDLIALFGLPLVAGDPATALARPDAVVISEDLARRLFGDSNALSQTVRFSDGDAGVVTAVLRDLPANTHLRFDGLRPMSAAAANLPGGGVGDWVNQSVFTYARLSGRPSEDLAARIQAMAATAGNPSLADRIGGDAWPVADMFRPVTDIYLWGPSLMRPEGNPLLVAAVAGVTIVIAIFAISNFAAFQSAQFTGRTREVGIRKCLGAKPRHIVGDFLLEGLLLATLATLAAFVMVEVLLALFPGQSSSLVTRKSLSDPLVLAGTFLTAQIAVSLGTVGGAIRLGAAPPPPSAC